MISARTRSLSSSHVFTDEYPFHAKFSDLVDDVYRDEAKAAMQLARKRFALEAKLEAAKIRRDRFQYSRELHTKTLNNKDWGISLRARHRRWEKDHARENEAFSIRKANQEQVMLKQVE